LQRGKRGVVAQGNPKEIRKEEDLARRDLRLMNRETAREPAVAGLNAAPLGFKTSEVKG
jgi:ABC-type sulfate transport system substrate-binding protein